MSMSPTGPLRFYLLRWPVSQEEVEARLRALEGRVLSLRRDGMWRICLPAARRWRGEEIASGAWLVEEPVIDRVSRPLGGHLLPEGLSKGYSTPVRVVDPITQRPIPGARVVLEGASGISYQADTNPEGIALLHVLEEEWVQLDVLPTSGYWPMRQQAGISSPNGTLEVSLTPITGAPTSYGWGFTRAMKIDRVHEAGITGKGVRVAVLDTGVSPHPDLRIVGGVNTTDREDDRRWQDTHWHGTHVAGIVGAVGHPGALVGVAPECELFAVRVGRVETASATRFTNTSFETDLIEGLEWCLNQGIEVVNMSLFARPSRVLDELLEECWRRGMVVVAPSGNRRGLQDAAGVDYPALHPRVISVGAVGRLGTYPEGSYFSSAEEGASFSPRFSDYYIPGFSRSGPGLDFVAPGVAILSTVPSGLSGWDATEQRLVGYTAWMGTSQAAPFIAGLSALVLESHADIRRLTDGRRVDAVREVMRRSAVSLGLDRQLEGNGMPFAPACLNQAGLD
ncbi:MAG: S8 family peptidase [Myxococcota bacterium]